MSKSEGRPDADFHAAEAHIAKLERELEGIRTWAIEAYREMMLNLALSSKTGEVRKYKLGAAAAYQRLLERLDVDPESIDILDDHEH